MKEKTAESIRMSLALFIVGPFAMASIYKFIETFSFASFWQFIGQFTN